MPYLRRIEPPDTHIGGVGAFPVGDEREVSEDLAREFEGLPGWQVRRAEPPRDPRGRKGKESD
jgi:hypothetical protein